MQDRIPELCPDFEWNGMESERTGETLKELLSLWGFYLTIQDDPSSVALREIKELLTNRCFTDNTNSTGYHEVLRNLIKTCKLYGILDESDKIELCVALEGVGLINLNRSILTYLYDVGREASESIFEDISNHEFGEESMLFSISSFKQKHRAYNVNITKK